MCNECNEELTYEDRLKIMNGELYKEIYKKEKDKIDRLSIGWAIDTDFFGHFRRDKKASSYGELMMASRELSEEDVREDLKKLEGMKMENVLMISYTYMKPCDVDDGVDDTKQS